MQTQPKHNEEMDRTAVRSLQRLTRLLAEIAQNEGDHEPVTSCRMEVDGDSRP